MLRRVGCRFQAEQPGDELGNVFLRQPVDDDAAILNAGNERRQRIAERLEPCDGREVKLVQEGLRSQSAHPLLSALPSVEIDYTQKGRSAPPESWVAVEYEYAPATRYYAESLRLIVRPNLERDSEPGDWPWIIARVRMHAALNHIAPQRTDLAWSAACWAVAEALLINAGLGSRPAWLAPLPQGYKFTDENALADRLRENVPDEFLGLGLGAKAQPFWTCTFPALTDKMRAPSFQGEVLLITKSGEPRPVLVSLATEARANGEPERIGVFGFVAAGAPRAGIHDRYTCVSVNDRSTSSQAWK